MSSRRRVPQFTLPSALQQFAVGLRAANKSPKTVQTYSESVRLFIRYAETQGVTMLHEVTPDLIRGWFIHMADSGNSEGTRFNRHSGLKAYLRWASEEGMVTPNPMDRIPAPKPSPSPVPILSEADIKALLGACRGQGFEELRDNALIRLLYDTGMRRSEASGLRGRMTESGTIEGDLDLDLNVAHVMGKGRRQRACPFGVRTSQALVRYLRTRFAHPYEHRPELWLGKRGPLNSDALLDILQRRARKAGMGRVFVHQLRHTWASTMLSEGLSPEDVMRLGGWVDRDMLAKYGSANADERARAAYRAKSPGDRL